jgi:prepilin-type N-terminal cleavage/methylation domain-containing protein
MNIHIANARRAKKNTERGFTLIELLVVISIIALLSTLAMVALNNARAKSRDAKRVSDVKQIQTALELYFTDQQGYPGIASATAGTKAATDCLGAGSAGFTAVASCGTPTYMGQVPNNPTPVAAAGTTNYIYAASGTVDANGHAPSYTLTFGLENKTGILASGAHTATPDGIQ